MPAKLELISVTTLDNRNEIDMSPIYQAIRDESEKSTKTPFDQAISLLGFGWFHLKLTLICGWANATDAVELMCVSLAMPSVQCELGLTSSQLGVISAVVFVGMMIGGYTWGSLGDVVGRKPVLITALAANAIFGFLSAFARSYCVFLVCRVLSGFGVGGSIPVIWSYFVEWQPAEHRGRMLSFIASFWMVGQLVVCGMAWLIIPLNVSWNLGSFQFRSWRIFLAASTFICASSALLILFIPESPKYLLQKRKSHEALAVLRRAYRENHGEDNYPVEELKPIRVHETSDGMPAAMNIRARIMEAFSEIYCKTVELTKKPLLKVTTTIVVINFVLAFGYYGLTLWFPELFTRSRSEGHSGKICSTLSTANGTNANSSFCDNLGDTSVFRDNFIISLSSLPGNIFSILFMDRIGRKRIFVAGIISTALSAFLIYIVENATQVLIMSSVFAGVSVLCWNCLDCFMSELFPTHLRSTSMGIGLAFARIGAIFGNLTFGLLFDQHCAVPLVLVAVLLTVGGIFSFFLPDVTKKSID